MSHDCHPDPRAESPDLLLSSLGELKWAARNRCDPFVPVLVGGTRVAPFVDPTPGRLPVPRWRQLIAAAARAGEVVVIATDLLADPERREWDAAFPRGEPLPCPSREGVFPFGYEGGADVVLVHRAPVLSDLSARLERDRQF